MGPSTRAAIVVIAALVVAVGQADAAGTGSPALVAGGSPGATLTVADTTFGGFDELELTLKGATSSAEPSDRASDDVPLWPNEVVLVTQSPLSNRPTTRVLVGGAVNVAAAGVELGFSGGQVLRLPTVAGEAYKGRHAGQVRFFLGGITLPAADADDPPGLVRMLDASGAVIGVAKSPDIKRSVPLLRRRVSGALTRINATLTSELAPLPLAPERRTEELCLLVAVHGPYDDTGVCPDADGPMTLGGLRGCGRVPTTLTGFAPAAARALVVRLGSGRTVRLPTRATPFGRPGRIVAAVLPRGEAIRRAWAIDGAGRRLASGDLLVAPPDRSCDHALSTADLEHWDFLPDAPAPRFGTPPGTEVAAAVPSGPRLLVRDAGEELCVGVDRLDLDGGDCFSPPVNSHRDELLVDPGAGIVAGIYPAQVTAVDLRFRGGGTARVAASEGLGYTGRYRSAVHFVLTPIPPGKTVTGAVLLDASGREIGRAEADGPETDDKLIGRPSTVLSVGSGRRAVRLVAGATRSALYARIFPCIGLELGHERSQCDDQFDFGVSSVTAVVTCGSRRTVVFGIAHHAVPHVEISLSNGRRVRPRLVAFPRAAHTRARIFLAVFPRRAAVTRVRFTGQRGLDGTDTVALPTRKPARQCGYEARETLI